MCIPCRRRERVRRSKEREKRSVTRYVASWWPMGRDARHRSPPKRHLTKIRGCHNGVILRLPAEATPFLCDRRRGVAAARGGLKGEEKKRKWEGIAHGNQCIYIRVNHSAIVIRFLRKERSLRKSRDFCDSSCGEKG